MLLKSLLLVLALVCVETFIIQQHKHSRRHHKHSRRHHKHHKHRKSGVSHKVHSHEVSEKELQWVALKEKLTPMERAQRERMAQHRLKALEKVCNTFTKFTPCACHEVLTNAKIHHDHKIVYLEYPEYACDVKENSRRSDAGRITPGYTCAQLKTRRTLYRDEYQQPIELEIVYRAGCELRCINMGCQPVNQAVNDTTTNPDVVGEDKEWKKNKGKYVDIEESVEIIGNDEEKNKNELEEGINKRGMSDKPKIYHVGRRVSKEEETEHFDEVTHQKDGGNYYREMEVRGAGVSESKVVIQ